MAAFAFIQPGRRLGLPVRSGDHLTASKLADAQAMPESVDTMIPAIMAGANFILQSAGWLEGGLTIGYEKFVMDADCCGAIQHGVGSFKGEAAKRATRGNPQWSSRHHPHEI